MQMNPFILSALVVPPLVLTACTDRPPLQELACLEQPCKHPMAESMRGLLMKHYDRYRVGDEYLVDFPYIAVLTAMAAVEPELQPHLLDMLKALQAHGALAYQPDFTGTPALLYALMTGDTGVIEWFRSHGLSPEEVKDDSGRNRNSAMFAAWGGQLALLKELHAAGADLTHRDSMGQGVHFYAATGGSIECLEYLAANGVDITAETPGGASPALAAAYSGNVECLRYLQNKGCNVISTYPDGTNALMYAAWGGSIDMVEYLLTCGLSLHGCAEDGTTLMHHAAYGCQVSMLKYLLEKGLDVNTPNAKGLTPLMAAASSGNVEAIRFLLQRGADPSAKDSQGRTARDYALMLYHNAAGEL